MNFLNQVGIDNQSTTRVAPRNSIRVSKGKKPLVSILNFSRQSKNVVFTEPATIEAINRLGFEMSEFNFISLLKKLAIFLKSFLEIKINFCIKSC